MIFISFGLSISKDSEPFTASVSPYLSRFTASVSPGSPALLQFFRWVDHSFTPPRLPRSPHALPHALPPAYPSRPQVSHPSLPPPEPLGPTRTHSPSPSALVCVQRCPRLTQPGSSARAQVAIARSRPSGTARSQTGPSTARRANATARARSWDTSGTAHRVQVARERGMTTSRTRQSSAARRRL